MIGSQNLLFYKQKSCRQIETEFSNSLILHEASAKKINTGERLEIGGNYWFG